MSDLEEAMAEDKIDTGSKQPDKMAVTESESISVDSLSDEQIHKLLQSDPVLDKQHHAGGKVHQSGDH